MVADEITLQKVSISRIKQEMRDVYYLSDDLVIASFDPRYQRLFCDDCGAYQ